MFRARCNAIWSDLKYIARVQVGGHVVCCGHSGNTGQDDQEQVGKCCTNTVLHGGDCCQCLRLRNFAHCFMESAFSTDF